MGELVHGLHSLASKGIHRDDVRPMGCPGPGLARAPSTCSMSTSKQLLGPMHVGIVLNYCQYGVLYLGSYYNTGPYINFPHSGNSNLGKLPCTSWPLVVVIDWRTRWWTIHVSIKSGRG